MPTIPADRWRVFGAPLLTLVLGCALSGLVFWGLHAWEQGYLAREFTHAAKVIAASIRRSVYHNLEAVRTVGWLYASSHTVEYVEFQTFVHPLLTLNPSLRGMRWIKRVPQAERATFEAQARKLFPSFQILERGPSGQMVQAGEREEYYAALFVEPPEDQAQVLGFNIASEPTRRAAVERARDTGQLVVSARTVLSRGDKPVVAKVILLPIYAKGTPLETVAQRRQHLQGVVVAAFHVADAVAVALHREVLPQRGIDVYVYEDQANPPRDLLTFHPAVTASRSEYVSPPSPSAGGLQLRDSFPVADETWHLVLVPSAGAYEAGAAWAPWGALGAGLLVTALLAAYLWSAQSYTLKTERWVATLKGEVAERKRVEETLRLSEERIRTALKVAPVIVFNHDQELRYTWIHNPRLGFTSEMMIGKRDRELLEQPEEAEQLEATKRRVLKSGVGLRQEIQVHVGGATHYFDLTLEPLRDMYGQVVGITGAAVDVTEYLRLQAQLREQAAQLAEADQRKDEFLAMLGHELRNPLAPITNAIEVLKRRPGPPDPTVQWAKEVIGRQAEQLKRLVNDLLDVARITRGRIEFHRRLVTMAEVVSQAVEESHPLIEARWHELTIDLPSDPVWVEADPVRLTQIVSNLLNNAAKYTPEGGRIWLIVQRAGGEAVISVRDTGIGIAPELLPRIFDLFTRAERTSQGTGGLGLGLTLARRLVEMHGGRIGAESAGPGRGSIFTVRLPLSKPAPAVPQARPRTDAVSQRILVVEDNPDVAESLAMLLRALGHVVEVVPDGASALAAVRCCHPDVVFLDIGLPDMDGYEVARRLRAEYGPALHLVALTGYGQEADRRRAHETGFDRHLLKPATVEALERALATVAHPGGV